MFAKLIWPYWFSTLLILFLPCSGPAQEPVRDLVQIDQVAFQSHHLPWMTVLVTVTDQKNQVLKNLAQNNYLIEEDGVINHSRPTVRSFLKTDRQLDYVILIDHRDDAPTSLTMIGRATDEFITQMGFRYSGVIVSYTDQPRIVAGPVRDPDLLSSAVLALEPVNGRPKPVQGLLLGVKTLNDLDSVLTSKLSRKIIVFLTDGAGGEELFTQDAAEARLLESDIKLFTIGYGSKDNPGLAGWAALSRETGGDYFFVTHPDQLPTCLAALVERLKNQYVLTFPAERIKPDGRVHRLKILVDAKGIKTDDMYAFVSPLLPKDDSPPWLGLFAVFIGVAFLIWLVSRGGFEKREGKNQRPG